MDGAHDMGGMHGFGRVVEDGCHDVFHEDWEPRVFGLQLTADLEGPGGRATRELMPPAEYIAAGYYERWLWGAEQRALRGTIGEDDLARWRERLAADPGAMPEVRDEVKARAVVDDLRIGRPMGKAEAPRFKPGDRVRVLRMHPPVHTRCPRYVRGVAGDVLAVQGTDRLPDRAIVGEHPDPEPVYSVRFASRDLWGEGGEAPFTVTMDLWDSYLEPA